MNDERRRIFFEAEICLAAAEIAEFYGSVAQAVQNEIGHTGAEVISAHEVDPHTGEPT